MRNVELTPLSKDYLCEVSVAGELNLLKRMSALKSSCDGAEQIVATEDVIG